MQTWISPPLLRRPRPLWTAACIPSQPCGIARHLARLLLPEPLRRLLSNAVLVAEPAPVILLNGISGCGKRTAAQALSHIMKRNLLTVDLRLSLSQALLLDDYLALLLRDAAMANANLFFAHAESLDAERFQHLLQWLESSLTNSPSLTAFIGISSPQSPRIAPNPSRPSFNLPVPSFQTRIDLWTCALAATGLAAPQADLVSLSSKFVLTADKSTAPAAPPRTRPCCTTHWHVTSRHNNFRDCARRESNQALTRLAQRIESIYTWNDLILPRRALQQLREVCSSHKYRRVVYSEWGFDQRLAMGKGLNIPVLRAQRHRQNHGRRHPRRRARSRHLQN